jgi:hypothetical protein
LYSGKPFEPSDLDFVSISILLNKFCAFVILETFRGFSISLNGMSDAFSLIEDIEADLSNLGNNDRQYNWTPIETANIQPSEQSFTDINQDARSRKDLPSLALLQEQRALDLNKPDVINPNSMPNAISSR